MNTQEAMSKIEADTRLWIEIGANKSEAMKRWKSHDAMVEALRAMRDAYIPGICKRRTVRQKWDANAKLEAALELAGA